MFQPQTGVGQKRLVWFSAVKAGKNRPNAAWLVLD